jgi:hypothetical protein
MSSNFIQLLNEIDEFIIVSKLSNYTHFHTRGNDCFFDKFFFEKYKEVSDKKVNVDCHHIGMTSTDNYFQIEIATNVNKDVFLCANIKSKGIFASSKKIIKYCNLFVKEQKNKSGASKIKFIDKFGIKHCHFNLYEANKVIDVLTELKKIV